MSKLHELKCWEEYYDKVEDGSKPFEVRKDDRDYQVGDILHLRRWDHIIELYTGEHCLRVVTYILRGPGFGIEDGYVVMGLK